MAIGYLDSQYLTDIADAIRAKDGSQNTYTPSQMPQAILDIPSGGESDPIAVRFLDFDGTVVDELTDQELTALTELPSAPDHTQDEIPLTFDEWNWLLADIKTFRTANPTWTVNVGANYHTTDGKTHLIQDTPVDEFLACIKASSGLVIDWGDGSPTETSQDFWLNHTYITKGKYDLTITGTGTLKDISFGSRNTGSYFFIKEIRLSSDIQISNDSTSYVYSLMNVRSISYPSNLTKCCTTQDNLIEWVSIPRGATTIQTLGCCLKYQPMIYGQTSFSYKEYSKSLKEALIPSSAGTLSSGTFSYNSSLERASVKANVTSLPNDFFRECSALKEVELPDTITTIGDYAFNTCESLTKIKLPASLTTIGSWVFYKCYSLREIEIPSMVTSIGGWTFADTRAIIIRMKPTTPPTVTSNPFGSNSYIPELIIVPYSADHSILNAYQTATNWSSYASKMVEAEPTT